MKHPQKAFIKVGKSLLQIDLPGEHEEVLPSVSWGNVAGFPTVAYWMYKVLERRLTNSTVSYKLGNTLLEEVGACLLGGHGIPAEKGLAAYKHMKSMGAFDGSIYSADTLLEWLSQPISLNSKTFKYRFAKQKSQYIHSAISMLASEAAPIESGQQLRNWLLDIKGVGLKTASWIARNWLDADDVAILDIHIYRAGILGGFFDQSMSVERNYIELEDQFISLANSMGVKTAELDALMWYEMQQSPSVLELLSHKERATKSPQRNISTQNSYSGTHQIALI